MCAHTLVHSCKGKGSKSREAQGQLSGPVHKVCQRESQKVFSRDDMCSSAF